VERIVRRALIAPVRISLPGAQPSPPRPISPLVLFYPYIVLIFIGTGLLMLPWASHQEGPAPFMDAFFTATSAITVTGLSTVDVATYWTGLGQVIILVLVQLGGLGIIIFSTLLFIVIGRRIGLRERMALRDATGTNFLGGVVRLARTVGIVVFTVEALGWLALSIRFAMGPDDAGHAIWHGLFQTVTAYNNAGFVNLPGKGLEGFQNDPAVLLTLAVLVILGGISVAVMMEMFRKRRLGRLSLDAKLVLAVSLALWAVGTGLFLATEYSNAQTLGPLDWPEKLLNSFFESVVARTAGFASTANGAWKDYTLLVFVVLMFIIASVIATMRGRPRTEVFRREIPDDQVSRALTLGFVATVIVFGVVFGLTILEDAPVIDLMFETVSAFATVGKSTGITPDLSTGGLLLLIMMMLIGKIGPLTLMLALTQRAEPADVRYAQERIRIG
jgi:trk system potassium uptake protein TrkH